MKKPKTTDCPTPAQVHAWLLAERHNGEWGEATTGEIANHFQIRTRKAHKLCTALEKAGQLCDRGILSKGSNGRTQHLSREDYAGKRISMIIWQTLLQNGGDL